MIKKIACFLAFIMVITFLSSCGTQPSDTETDTTYNEKVTSNYSDNTTDKNADSNQDSSTDEDNVYVYEAETSKEWDLQMFLNICKNYEISCYGVEIQPEEQVSFENTFNYFALVGCTNTHLKTTRPELNSYFDEEIGKFVVPCEIVEQFLLRRFNTEVNRELIEYYDPDDNTYVFPQYIGEFHNEQDVLITDFNFRESLYTLDIAIYNSLDDSGLSIPLRRRYTIELYDDYEYRFVSVQTLDASTLSSSSDKKCIAYKDGIVCVAEKKSKLDSTQVWWLVAVPNKDGVYTIRTAYDGAYGLCVNKSSEIVIRKMRNWASVSDDRFVEFQYQIIPTEDNSFIIKSLYTNEYIMIGENGPALTPQAYAISIENVTGN